jgi:hypothetical protein
MNIIVPRHYTKEVEANFTAGLKGEYQIQVIDKEGNIRYPLGEQFHPNVITNIGLARLLTNSNPGRVVVSFGTDGARDSTLSSAILWCRAGSGSTAAAATDTQLENQYIAVGSPVATPTNFTGTGGSLTDSTLAISAGSVVHKWTKQFAAVTGAFTINELGLGWHQSDASTLFSRFVTPAPINLTDGQILRVVYQLTVSCPQYIDATTITGLSSNGFDMTGTAPDKGIRVTGDVATVFGQLDSTGVTAYPVSGGRYGLLPSTVGQATGWQILALGSGGTSFPAVGSASTVTTLATTNEVLSRSTVTPSGSPVVDCVYEFTVSNPVNTVENVNTFHLGISIEGVPNYQLHGIFDNPQTKSNEYKLLIGIRSGWTRL